MTIADRPDTQPHLQHTALPVSAPILITGIALLIGAVTAAFVGSMLLYTRGHLSAPLDDTLIYFQYAKQTAHGDIMRYQDGDPRTTGATGFAYPFVLAAGYLAGFRENGLFVFALAFNTLMLAATSVLTFALARRLAGDTTAWVATAFVAINGWLAWTFLSMMETGLHTVFLLGLLPLYGRARENRREILPLACMLAVAPFVRPELAALALLLGAGWAIDAWRGGRRLDSATPWPPLAGAAVGAAALFAVVFATTGTIRTNTFVVQSLFADPNRTYTSIVSAFTSNFLDSLQTAFSWFGPQYAGTAAFALFVIGAASLLEQDWHARCVSLRSVAPVMALAGLATASLAQQNVIGSQLHRWAAPYEVLIVIVTVVGAWRVVGWLPSLRPLAAPASVLAFVLCGTATIGAIESFGKENSDIYFQQITAAQWVRQETPPDAIIAINDAGAMAYFGRRRILDLLGLTGPLERTDSYRQGSASVLESIERLPASERPTYYAIYPAWWDFSGVLVRQTGFAISRVTSAAANEEVIYTPMNELLNTGDETGPRGPLYSSWRIGDSLDVADIVSERDHDYRITQREVGVHGGEVSAAPAAGGTQDRILDGGRIVTGSERFTLRIPDPAKPYAVLIRADEATEETVTVAVNGEETQVKLPVTSNSSFLNAVLLRGESSPTSDLQITVTARPGSVGYRSYHYWLLQP